MKLRNRKAFTLVELIVVITILAILGMIAFLSFNGYSSSARDSVRLTDLDGLSKGMEVMISKGGTLPRPSSAIDIKAGTTTIGYQGYADKTVLGMISMSDAKDPLDSIYYTYSVNASQNKYQVLGFLESSDSIAYNSSPFIDSVYAEPASYSGRTVFTKGNALGILLFSGTLLPAQVVQQNIDTAGTSTGYITYFETKDSTASLTGNLLFSNIYNRRKDLLTDKTLAASDPTLVGYWDMETMSGGRLWDWSSYGNSGSLNGGIVAGGISGKKGKAMIFDGVDDVINISSTTRSTNLTESAWIKSSSSANSYVFGEDGDSSFALSINGSLSINTKIGAACNGSWTESFATPNGIILPNNWYYITWTHASSGAYILYVNGNAVATQNGGMGAFSSCSFGRYIGGINASGVSLMGLFPGLIDEVRIYNRALSDSEISTLYNATK